MKQKDCDLRYREIDFSKTPAGDIGVDAVNETLALIEPLSAESLKSLLLGEQRGSKLLRCTRIVCQRCVLLRIETEQLEVLLA